MKKFSLLKKMGPTFLFSVFLSFADTSPSQHRQDTNTDRVSQFQLRGSMRVSAGKRSLGDPRWTNYITAWQVAATDLDIDCGATRGVTSERDYYCQMTLEEAMNFCASLRTSNGGAVEWRLPTARDAARLFARIYAGPPFYYQIIESFAGRDLPLSARGTVPEAGFFELTPLAPSFAYQEGVRWYRDQFPSMTSPFVPYNSVFPRIVQQVSGAIQLYPDFIVARLISADHRELPSESFWTSTPDLEWNHRTPLRLNGETRFVVFDREGIDGAVGDENRRLVRCVY